MLRRRAFSSPIAADCAVLGPLAERRHGRTAVPFPRTVSPVNIPGWCSSMAGMGASVC